MQNFKTVEVTTDLLIIGPGMAGAGACVEAAHWAKKNNLKVTVVDKAAMERSGAVGMGLSAINQYQGENSPVDYLSYVRQDLMGLCRDDLVMDISRHVNGSVHLFEKYGLPIWKDKEGNYVHEGRWQLMINGESYKAIVAEAGKTAVGADNLYERVFIIKLLLDKDDKNRVCGAIGFSVRENTFYIFKCNACIVSAGGAVHVFKPRSTGEGLGRAWYPPWNSGSSSYLTTTAGAEMSSQEVVFIPARYKDAYGPVGAWFLLFKAKATSATGFDYMGEGLAEGGELHNWPPYGEVKPIPTCLRNHLMMKEMYEKGHGPILIHTDKAIAKIADAAPDKKAYKKEMKKLEAEAWEDFLDMTISQAILWASKDVLPEEGPSEIMPSEPYFIGSHSGASGAWTSGPEDIQTDESKKDYFLGYNRMTTVKGVFAAGDGVGNSSHKFSSGSFTEGRIAAKAAIKFCVENPYTPEPDSDVINKLKEDILAPLKLYEEKSSYTTLGAAKKRYDLPVEEVNPYFITPKMALFRLNKIMDEYVAGWGSQYNCSETTLKIALKELKMLKEDLSKLAARNLHELMRCWENVQRVQLAEAHTRHKLFREETRWPGYFYRTDFPKMDQENWGDVFVNSVYDEEKDEFKIFKKTKHSLVKIEKVVGM
ncbi:MAG: adenylyl-sulfate reductase subunit alpha [Desulfobacula sp.]|uniref:adenylyl-sulfate reductase subunit alpha n=1 Tax=Desulfobacula sp. TaxID=2593537 RepID=UPI0025C5A9F6|nr:adenylyl-sulfate reductase subunit alpha [Desulfobacula sp.]MCD4718799.1 adenylyl-sulfate reductase subunit alpha [Desulfobacula sp.]